MSAQAALRADVAAWDLPIRIFHWMLAACVLMAWVSYRYAEAIGDVTLVWHRTNGLFILTLLLWRVLWGFFGPPRARFRSFVRAPAEVWRYARDLVSDRALRYLGHNPLGAYMILALLAALAAQGAFGLFATDDNDLTGGPLYRLVSEDGNALATRWHSRIFHYVQLPLIAVHVAANILYGAVKREPLIGAMIHGRKPPAAYADAPQTPELPSQGLGLAFGALVTAAGIVCGGIVLAGGRF